MYHEGFPQYDSIAEEYEAKADECRAFIKEFPVSEQVKLFDLLKKLEKNRDFKKLIGEIYLQSEAVKLTHQLAQPGLKEDWIRDRLMGISCLKDFFFNIESRHEAALAQLEDAKANLKFYESELEALRGELTE